MGESMTCYDGQQRFAVGVELFRERNFDGAILVWERLESEGYEHPNLALYLGAARRERTRQDQFVDGFSEDLSAAFAEEAGAAAKVDVVRRFDEKILRELFRRKAWDEALGVLNEAMAGDPTDATVLLLMARVQIARGDFPRALAAARKVALQDPTQVALNASLGSILAELDQRDLAEKAFRRALEGDDTNVVSWVGLGNLYFEQHRLRLAEDCLSKALGIQPGLINATTLLDEVREASAANERAINDARKIVAEHPGWPDWQHKLGVALMAEGDHAGAHACFTRALESNARLAKTWFQRGILLSFLGRFEESCADLRQALELADDFDDELFDEAQALEESGVWEDAVSVYGRAMRFETNYASRHIDLAKRFFQEELFDEAEREVAKGLSLSAHYPDGYCVLARLQLRKGLHDEAVDSLHRALEIHPRYGDAVVTLVETLMARGEEKQARVWARRYEREMADDADLQERLRAALGGGGEGDA